MMTYAEAVKSLLLEGANHSDPLYYAYCDGYYAAKTMKNPTSHLDYIGVATANGYYKSVEVLDKYQQGLEAGLIG